MDYRQITRLLGGHEPGEPPPLDMLGRHVADVWTSYQDSQFGQVTRDLPAVLAAAQLATREYTGDDQARAYGLLAMTYQAAAMTLTKVGETDLAWTASDRGLAAAERSGDPVVLGSLFRSVAHSLLSTGQHAAAVRLTSQAADYLRGELALRSPATAPRPLPAAHRPRPRPHQRRPPVRLRHPVPRRRHGRRSRRRPRHHPRLPHRSRHRGPSPRPGRQPHVDLLRARRTSPSTG